MLEKANSSTCTCYVHLFVFQDESVPYSFFINESEITGSLKETLETQTLETEKVVEIVYQPQAVFKVRAVTRCTSTIPGMLFIYIGKVFKNPLISYNKLFMLATYRIVL